jgi:carboxymethylenebutenolidase
MSQRIHYTAKDGTKLEGAQAEPDGSGKAPAIVIVQEWHGISAHISGLVDRFAAEGFLAIAPDLYHGKLAKDDAEAGKLMGALDKPKAVKEVVDAIAFARTLPRSNGKVALTGFCLGGALTFAAAAQDEQLSAALPFYGLPSVPVDWTKVRAPIQAHFAKVDDWATVSGAEEIQRAIAKAGRTTMELHVYDAGHAFMRETDPRKYDAPAAKLAWERSLAFLRKHLA